HTRFSRDWSSDVCSSDLGRALMTEPKLIMLDEPSLGLSPLLVQEIFGIIREINQREKVSVLLVEQNAAAALEVVNHAYLIENGQIGRASCRERIESTWVS